jgi:hypothetical protein
MVPLSPPHLRPWDKELLELSIVVGFMLGIARFAVWLEEKQNGKRS